MPDDSHPAQMLNQEGPSDLDVILSEGLRDKVTRQAERNYYLGELRERIIKSLSFAQVKAAKIYPEILQAIQDPRASHVLLHHVVPIKLGSRYEKPARAKGLTVTYVSDPNFKGQIGLVVAAADAVDVENIEVAES